jgi:hypothetical protein
MQIRVGVFYDGAETVNKDVCKACFTELFAGMDEFAVKFENDWRGGAIYCPSHMGGAYVMVRDEMLPEGCKYTLEQVVAGGIES